MSKIIVRSLLLIFLGLFVFNVLVYVQQPGMLFYPTAKLEATPGDWGLDYEDVILTSRDNVKLHGWFLPAKHSQHVILFFHGNGGNISHRADSLKIFHSLGLNVMIIDYRGYGKSDGVMSEQGAYQDAQAAWQYLVTQRGYRPQDIIIFGRSLGGAIATRLATQVDQRALILESTFSSIRDMASQMMPLVSHLIYLRYQFDTEKSIARVNSPVLLMHSKEDETIPYEHAEKIFAAANSPKYFFELSGSHNSGFLQNVVGYKQAIYWFLYERGD